MKEDNRIPIVVGVTGHRALRPQDEEALRAAVSAELKKLTAQYPRSPVVMLTSLAEGGDLLCAEAATELLTWTQREETAWIALALSALAAAPAPTAAHEIGACWVEDQRRYHESALARSGHDCAVSGRVVRASLILSVTLYCAAAAFELCCGGALCPALLPVGNAEAYRTALKIALGLLSAVTLLIAGYYGRLSLSRVSGDHRKMERFYAAMSARLARCGQTEALLTLLAREELIENGNWCSYQRDNAPDLSI